MSQMVFWMEVRVYSAHDTTAQREVERATILLCLRHHSAPACSQGDALVLWDVEPDGAISTHALHAGCPVKDGEKWVSGVRSG
jgi:hypothetical protein